MAVETGPLPAQVLDYVETMEQLVPVVKAPDDWAPLAEFVAVDEFERIGTFLEVQDWEQYIAMLTQWASATPKFETWCAGSTSYPVSSTTQTEERHFRGGDRTDVVNSLTVFEFNAAGKIRHLEVYLQQPR